MSVEGVDGVKGVMGVMGVEGVKGVKGGTWSRDVFFRLAITYAVTPHLFSLA